MFKEFKAFAMRGNVLDMAVGIIIGAAFGQIVTSFVQDILMPPIGRLLGHVDFSNLFLSLSGAHYDTVAAAKANHDHPRDVAPGSDSPARLCPAPLELRRGAALPQTGRTR